MTGSLILSVNLTNRKNPAKPNYHISIKKSQAKCTENIGLPVIQCHKTWFRLVSPTYPNVTLTFLHRHMLV